MLQPCISNPPSILVSAVHCLPDEEIEDEYEEEYGEDSARIDIDLADLGEAVVALGLLLSQYSQCCAVLMAGWRLPQEGGLAELMSSLMISANIKARTSRKTNKEQT